MSPLAQICMAGKKRKREALPSQSKKLKFVAQDKTKDNAQARILLLESQILESRIHYNNIAVLIATLRDQDVRQGDLTVAVSLCRVFSRLLAAGHMTKTKDTLQDEYIVQQWLKERYTEFTAIVITILKEGSPENQNTALTLSMRLLKDEASHLKNSEEYVWRAGLFPEILRALVESDAGEEGRESFTEQYLQQYDDIRLYTFTIMSEILSSDNPREIAAVVPSNVIKVLSDVEAPPTSKEQISNFYISPPKRAKHPLYSLKAHKKAAQEAWLSLIRTGLGTAHRKALLSLVSPKIAPWFLKVELLMDFLTDSYDVGGSVSLLALSGLFYLIQEKNLDYPLFYQKLYSLLDAGILHSKHRSRFLRLLDTFLASTHLPAALVASFIKRLSRLMLHAPPAGIVAIIPWIYNLLKRHPTCTFMVHREVRTAEAKQQLTEEGMNDPFNMHENDPMHTNAIESSLWEIEMLQSHYHPNVATLAKIISGQFTKQGYNLEDFLDHSYASVSCLWVSSAISLPSGLVINVTLEQMLDAELLKDLKKPPVIEYEIPKRIFTKHEAESPLQNSLLVTLWDFS
ncbi:MAG: hypothetical protein M1812_006676 [Candelaria pacifica]|nr:MAG: hypothetical protein M1812_006676 [Candelaria pacifica]